MSSPLYTLVQHIMISFDQLRHEEQAHALQPAHVFPVTAAGRTPDTGELLLSAKLLVGAAKKELHRIPGAGPLSASMATFWPMLSGALPDTSAATLRSALPAVYVANWAENAVWMVSQFHQATHDDKCLMQAQIADQIIDSTLQHAIQVMPLREFLKHLSGTADIRIKHKLGQLIFWYAVYTYAARAQRKLPICQMTLTENDRVADCPLTRGKWLEHIQAAKSYLRIEPPLSLDNPEPQNTGATKVWKKILHAHRPRSPQATEHGGF